MSDSLIDQSVRSAKEGDEAARERLIARYRSFILRSVSHICKQPIGWHHDEASLGLIAFNSAIDRFDVTYGKSFDNFAFMIIRNQLVDEFRRRGKMMDNESLVLDSPSSDHYRTADSSVEAYDREQSANELALELIQYDELLQEYGISLEQLEEFSPKHRDARKEWIRLAKRFSERPEWMETLTTTKRLPVKEMLRTFRISVRSIERNRKYLIALVLIFACEDFGRIRSAVSFADVEE